MKENGIILRTASLSDREFIFSLVNDESVRAMSFHSERIDWSTHCIWYARQVEERSPFYIALNNDELCGYVRFQERGTGHWREDVQDAIVTLAVHPNFRHQGFAAPILMAACRAILERTSVLRIHALVKACNQASLATFRKCRFVETGRTTYHGVPTICFVYPGHGE